MFVGQRQFALLAEEFLARQLDPRGKRDAGFGRQPKANIIVAAGRRRGIGEQQLRRRLELDQHFGRGPLETFARAQIERHALPAPGIDEQAQRAEGFDLESFATPGSSR